MIELYLMSAAIVMLVIANLLQMSLLNRMRKIIKRYDEIFKIKK